MRMQGSGEGSKEYDAEDTRKSTRGGRESSRDDASMCTSISGQINSRSIGLKTKFPEIYPCHAPLRCVCAIHPRAIPRLQYYLRVAYSKKREQGTIHTVANNNKGNQTTSVDCATAPA